MTSHSSSSSTQVRNLIRQGIEHDPPPPPLCADGGLEAPNIWPTDLRKANSLVHLTVVTSITGVLVLVWIGELLRRQQLREKYAALWLATGIVVAPLGFFPNLLDSTARKLGIASGVSLVLFLGFLLVLLVCVHLSYESSRLEAETRTLSEEIAMIRAHLVERDGFPMAGQHRLPDGLVDPEVGA